ncbi:hypothetical protein [Sphingomonas sp.]|uniref:hypothetical protein n=1 Tax=Sphingomonas sp. TaxID=28214 RepID=UPI00286A32D6|nr:hypothetical protein [Sphingomonas sp.]
MNPLWEYFWPIFVAGIVIGAVAGQLAFRQLRIASRDRSAGGAIQSQEWQRTRKIYFGGGAVAALAAAMLWSGPLGGSERLTSRVESSARATLDHLEMTQVDARLQRDPLRRRLVLSGPADEFQRGQLVQILDDIHGVADVRWATPPQASSGAK